MPTKKIFVLKWSRPSDQVLYPGQSELFLEEWASIDDLRSRLKIIKQIESDNGFKILECAEYLLLCQIDLSSELV